MVLKDFRNLLHPISIAEVTCIHQHTFTTFFAFCRAPLPSNARMPILLSTSIVRLIFSPCRIYSSPSLPTSSSSLNSQDKPRWR
jgi:hypothetical protein